jgi:hypothetical protein
MDSFKMRQEQLALALQVDPRMDSLDVNDFGGGHIDLCGKLCKISSPPLLINFSSADAD